MLGMTLHELPARAGALTFLPQESYICPRRCQSLYLGYYHGRGKRRALSKTCKTPNFQMREESYLRLAAPLLRASAQAPSRRTPPYWFTRAAEMTCGDIFRH